MGSNEISGPGKKTHKSCQFGFIDWNAYQSYRLWIPIACKSNSMD